jgi:hypothetical protein
MIERNPINSIITCGDASCSGYVKILMRIKIKKLVLSSVAYRLDDVFTTEMTLRLTVFPGGRLVK